MFRQMYGDMNEKSNITGGVCLRFQVLQFAIELEAIKG
jgi:hypothetical protein